MHIISKKALREFWEQYPDSETPLRRWFRIIDKNDFRNFAELRATFGSADVVDDFIVFNISGNKYRLVVVIHFNRGKVFIRQVLTHAGYDEGEWKR